MLNYELIAQINKARRRIKRQLYRWQNEHTQDSDRMLLFTWETPAIAQSQDNLDLCLAQARAHDQDLLVIKPYILQVAGRGNLGRSEQVKADLFPQTWLAKHNAWLDSSSGIWPVLDSNSRGEMVGFYSYRACLCLDEHQGVYDVATGQRLTNRRATIERMWDMGFAATRGRPLSMAKPRWTGSREDLEHVTQLADQYWQRQNSSEMARKMCSAYRSINRYAAWPGAW